MLIGYHTTMSDDGGQVESGVAIIEPHSPTKVDTPVSPDKDQTLAITEMKQLLSSDSKAHVHFYKKSRRPKADEAGSTALPVFTKDQITAVMSGQDEQNSTWEKIERLEEFLHHQSMSDDFGKNHGARIEWEKELDRRDPQLYNYYETNQLKKNSLMKVYFSLLVLQKYLRTSTNEQVQNFGDQTKTFAETLLLKLKGNVDELQYDYLPDAKKLGVVQYFENAAVDYLRNFAKALGGATDQRKVLLTSKALETLAA